MPRPTLSIVIPCFNEEDVIPELDRRLRGLLDELGETWEVVFVDDGSKDRTHNLLTELAKSEKRYRVVTFSRNFGHQLAITAGVDHAIGAAVAVMDADLQDPPEVVRDMIAKWREGFDVVYGVRAKRENESIFKRATAAAFYRIMRMMVGMDLPLDTGDFRLMGRNVVLALRGLKEAHRFVRGMVVWVGFRQTAVYYTRAGRFAGETKYPLRKMLRFAIDGITSFSIIPLRISSYLGVVAGIGAVGLGLWSVYVRFFIKAVVQGWTSTIMVVALLASAQLIMIGVLGEYVGRIYEQVKQRPLYIVRDVVNGAPDNDSEDDPRSPEEARS
jgi:polyisoprenyl-phosphate glycosyltransferase